ncbi:MAG TPA: rhodanese-like domain-containing protein [Janthinobacterium sp.]|nr:rhodanese-like domain-containing protein [Janthinobacterium sp.]
MSALLCPFPAVQPRRRQLLTPAGLQACAGVPEESGKLRLFEVGCGGAAAFLSGHIPGAGYLDTKAMERPPLWNKVDDASLLRLLLENGISSASCVVLYGRDGGGTLAAARAAHLLLYAGVADVRLLDGGLAAWRGAGLPLLRGAAPAHAPAPAFGASFPARPDYLIDTAGAKALLAQENGVLASIRSRAEFMGLTSGYGYIAASGDIPGARWGRAGADGDVNSMSDYQQADGTMKPAAAILRFWRRAGIGPQRRTAFYCGTGWRASLAFFYAWSMGWDDICVYDGGWYEWSADPANPLARAGLCTAASSCPAQQQLPAAAAGI